MEILWFRDRWGKISEVNLEKQKLTVFTKGKEFAGATKFPLLRGELKQNIWEMPEATWDVLYSVYNG